MHVLYVLHFLKHTCVKHHMDYEVWCSSCHSGSLNVSHYASLQAILWELHAEGLIV